MFNEGVIDKRLMQDKASVYALAMLNVEARHGVLTAKEHEADVIFALDRKPVRKGQKLVTIYDKDVITTEYMVPKLLLDAHKGRIKSCLRQ